MSDDAAIFERFAGRLVLETGGRMVVEPFQGEALADYFRGAVETLIVLPKKNGKSTLLAALAIFHLLITEDAECVIAAASREQATILYDQAAGFVRRSPELADRVLVKRGYRELRSTRDAGRIRVLAADVDTADGVIPTLALVDELHRHRSAGLYGVFRDGLGPRQGRMVTISTAGDAETSPLGRMRAAARSLPGIRRAGRHTHATSDDGSFALHEWALDNDDDRDDMRVVKQANPASWQTIDALRLRHDSPSMLPSQWARFACGIWLAGEGWWMNPDAWAEAADPLELLRPGEHVTLGFDGSRVGDSTALVACRLADGLLTPLGIWEAPEGDAGQTWEVPTYDVEAAVAEAMETYRVIRGYFDPPLWRTEIDAWTLAYGEEAVVKYETNRPRMMAATDRFRTDVNAHTLRHTGDVTLTRHVLNAQMREGRGGYYLVKERQGSPNKIDAAVAAVLAYEARADAIAGGALRRKGRVMSL